MAIKPSRPTFDAAAKHRDGTLNLELERALSTFHERLAVLERGQGIGGLDSDNKSKVSVRPPRADVGVRAVPGSGQLTVSLTNPEFIPGRGNPLRTPIYHKLRYGPDPTFRDGAHETPPSFQTHWPLLAEAGSKVHVEVASSFDGVHWNLPIIKGPFKV